MSDKKRLTFADSKWSKTDLSYTYENYTPDISKANVETLTGAAFKFWSDVSPLKFTVKASKGDILIS